MITRSSKVFVDNVEDFVFCPQKLYLTEVIRANHPEPVRVGRGKEKHKIREDWISRKGEKSVLIDDEELELVGKIDGLIEYSSHIVVIEIKDTDRDYYYQSEKIQGVLYAELVRRERKKPVKLVFRSRGKDKEIPITDELKEKAMESLKKTKKVVKGDIIPEEENSEKCIRCPLKNICG